MTLTKILKNINNNKNRTFNFEYELPLGPFKRRAKPISIDFRNNPWDRKVLSMTKHRFFSSVIEARTGLTKGQIAGRRKKAGIKVTDFMRGIDPKSRKVLNKIDTMFGDLKKMQRLIKQNLKQKKIK